MVEHARAIKRWNVGRNWLIFKEAYYDRRRPLAATPRFPKITRIPPFPATIDTLRYARHFRLVSSIFPSPPRLKINRRKLQR